MKNLSSLICHLSSRKGFTLVELIMSLGILSLLITVLTGVFGAIIDTSLDSNATSRVDQDGRYIMARFAYDTQHSTQIVDPAVPASTTQAFLKLKINAIDYKYSIDGNGNLQITDVTNNTQPDNLNSYLTQVSNLTFQRIGIGDATDTVQVKFKLTSRIKESKGSETKNFQTTLGIQ